MGMDSVHLPRWTIRTVLKRAGDILGAWVEFWDEVGAARDPGGASGCFLGQNVLEELLDGGQKGLDIR